MIADRAVHGGALDQVVHAVEAAQKVVLPQPDGPMNAVTRFLWICMLTSGIASLPL